MTRRRTGFTRSSALHRLCALLTVVTVVCLDGHRAAAQARVDVGQQQLINLRDRTDSLQELGGTPTQDIPPRVEGQDPPPSALRLAFPTQKIEVSGSTIYTKEQLAPLLRPYLARPNTLASLYALGDAIAAKYLADGYPYTTVTVPGQHIVDGRIDVRVVEFNVGEVEFRLDDKPVPIPAPLRTAVADILVSRPVRLDALRRAEADARAMGNTRVATTRVDRLRDGRARLTILLTRSNASGIAIQPVSGPLRQQQDASRLEIPVREVRVVGNTALTAEQLAPAFARLVGQVATLAQIREAAQRVAALYAEAGYFGSTASVPPQIVDNGIVTIEVSELAIGKVTVRLNGKALPPGDLLSRAANAVTLEQPVTIAAIQRQLYVLNHVPGVTVQSIIPPVIGQSDGQIELQRKPWTFITALDNRGAQVTGPLEVGALVGESGLMGLNEQVQLLGLKSIPLKQVSFAGLQFVVPLSSSGLVANGLVSHTSAKPGGYLTPLDIAATGDLLSLGLSYPVVARPDLSTLLTFAFDAANNSASVFGGKFTSSDERSRALRFGTLTDFIDPTGGQAIFKAIYSQNVNAIGARPNDKQVNPRPGIDLGAGKFNLDLRYEHPLPAGFKVAVGLRGQYGLSPLPSADVFTFGGVDFGRAYDSGIISGDSGFAGKVALSHAFPLANPILPFIDPYLFYDNGEVFSALKTPGVSGSASAASVGVGTRFATAFGQGGYIELDQALTRAAKLNSRSNPARVFFLLFTQF